MATPFVQGRLRQAPLSVRVDTSCAHCDAPLTLTIDQDLNYELGDPESDPIIFVPQVDLFDSGRPNIIDSF
ncbi:MAG: hypothetical protein KJ621_08095 [Proteobacteria bacterium]|nr:hypothetical protein [Pseudomonadota bacterium]